MSKALSTVASSAALPLIHSEAYDLRLGNHVFPSQKYALIRQQLLLQGHFAAADFIEPPAATDEQLRLAHTAEYVRKLGEHDFALSELLRMEIPFSQPLLQAFRLSAGGTILACRMARQQRIAVNLGGGFHHAYPDHGEGFCVLNDIAIGILATLREDLYQTAMVVDCDVHQGNGTHAIFQQEPRVFSFSIHQEENYPMPKERGDLDIGLDNLTGDMEYLDHLHDALDTAFARHQPELLVYVAGADPYRQDQLGGLGLTLDGLLRRDRLVMEYAARKQCAVAVTLAGGYARRVEDTVTIHCNTVLVAKRLYERGGL